MLSSSAFYTVEMVTDVLDLPLLVNIMLSLTTGCIAMKMIPSLITAFMKFGRFGIDMNKKSKPKIPESVGLIAGCSMFIIHCFLMSIPFGHFITQSENSSRNEFLETWISLSSIYFALVLGFVDDVFDLKWRYKLFIPVLASLPLVAGYYFKFNYTTVLLPKQLRHIFGSTLNLGAFYYVYIVMLAVFCTNAINILAGVNGLEVGQSVVIAVSILILNMIELTNPYSHSHLSLYYIIPFLGVSIPLLKYNWYPARIFVGDTFCYFAGMLFAVVGVLGHFSEMLLLLFIPQIFNFLYSLPQLLSFVPCPRHRLPRISSSDGKLEMSQVEFSLNEIPRLGKMIFKLFHRLHLIKIIKRRGDHITCNNFTLINLMLLLFGPMYEETLTIRLLILQIICSGIAFGIRYPLAAYFYDV